MICHARVPTISSGLCHCYALCHCFYCLPYLCPCVCLPSRPRHCFFPRRDCRPSPSHPRFCPCHACCPHSHCLTCPFCCCCHHRSSHSLCHCYHCASHLHHQPHASPDCTSSHFRCQPSRTEALCRESQSPSCQSHRC